MSAWVLCDGQWRHVGRVLREYGTAKHKRIEVDCSTQLVSKIYKNGIWTGRLVVLQKSCSVWTNTGHKWRSFDFPDTALDVTLEKKAKRFCDTSKDGD